MSRQVALGGVIGFLATVIVMATCQKSEPATQPPEAPMKVQVLQPVDLSGTPRRLPAEQVLGQPTGPRPMLVYPGNLQAIELLDAGRR
jgi:hypothetical protein